jgi:hypothetical protein
MAKFFREEVLEKTIAIYISVVYNNATIMPLRAFNKALSGLDFCGVEQLDSWRKKIGNDVEGSGRLIM